MSIFSLKELDTDKLTPKLRHKTIYSIFATIDEQIKTEVSCEKEIKNK